MCLFVVLLRPKLSNSIIHFPSKFFGLTIMMVEIARQANDADDDERVV